MKFTSNLLNYAMTRDFEYLTTIVVNSSLTVDDIGECCIEANNDGGCTWCLIIKTELGISEIFEVGPIIQDIEELPKSCNWSYKRISYSENQLSRIIDKFLNDNYRGITQAREISMEEAKSYFRDLANYI